MTRNMGGADRVIRVLAAIAIAASYYAGLISGTLAIVLGLFAVIFILTSAVSWCPAYVPFGISTRGKAGAAAP